MLHVQWFSGVDKVHASGLWQASYQPGGVEQARGSVSFLFVVEKSAVISVDEEWHCMISERGLRTDVIYQGQAFKSWGDDGMTDYLLHWSGKRAFHRSLNAAYGRIGRFVSEEVVIKTVTNKMSANSIIWHWSMPINHCNQIRLAPFRYFLLTFHETFLNQNMLIVYECREILELTCQVIQYIPHKW